MWLERALSKPRSHEKMNGGGVVWLRSLWCDQCDRGQEEGEEHADANKEMGPETDRDTPRPSLAANGRTGTNMTTITHVSFLSARSDSQVERVHHSSIRYGYSPGSITWRMRTARAGSVCGSRGGGGRDVPRPQP